MPLPGTSMTLIARAQDLRAVRVGLGSLGFVFVGVSIAGLLMPVLPAAPFFLIAALVVPLAIWLWPVPSCDAHSGS